MENKQPKLDQLTWSSWHLVMAESERTGGGGREEKMREDEHGRGKVTGWSKT